MGFKDLALFNDALLAKKTWRLLQNTNSLFYRVFKFKFFPRCSIMEATEYQLSLYAWRRILIGREVLKEVMRWKVGTGSNIRIWSGPWLPSEFLPFITSPTANEFEDAQMEALINPATNIWNSSLLQTLSLPRDIALIKSNPFSSNLVEDKLFWPFTPTGIYSVKSWYRILYKS